MLAGQLADWLAGWLGGWRLAGLLAVWAGWLGWLSGQSGLAGWQADWLPCGGWLVRWLNGWERMMPKINRKVAISVWMYCKSMLKVAIILCKPEVLKFMQNKVASMDRRC